MPSKSSDSSSPGQHPREATNREPIVLLVATELTTLIPYTLGLREAGYRVVAARSVSEAIARAKELPALDVLVTEMTLSTTMRLLDRDARYPAEHGLQLVRKVLPLHPDLAVVVLFDHSDRTLQALEALLRHKVCCCGSRAARRRYRGR